MRKQIKTTLAAFVLLTGLAVAAYNSLNYNEQGGARTVIGGSLDVASGGDLDMESGSTFKSAGSAIVLPPTASAIMYSTLTTNAADAANSVWGVSAGLTFEGSTVNAYETFLTLANPSADNTVTMADASGTIMLSSLATNAPDAANSVTGASNGLLFEGSTANDYELTLAPADPSADATITLPNSAGTVMLSSLATNAPDAANAVTGASNGLVFEGATADAYETTIAPADPLTDITLTTPRWTGNLPVIVLQSADTTDAANTASASTAFTLPVPASVFAAGKSIRITCAGTLTGTTATKIVTLWIDDAAIVTNTILNTPAGDFVSTFVVHEYTDLAHQKAFGFTEVQGLATTVSDYGVDTTDFTTAKNILVKVASGATGDHIINEFCMAEFLP